MSPRKPARSKKPAPRLFRLTRVERILLELYRTVPQSTRAQVGEILFDKWTHPATDAEQTAMHARYTAAGRAFNVGPLPVSIFDDLCAGDLDVAR